MATREQKARIVELGFEGMPRKDIAAEVGVAVRVVYETIAQARRNGRPVPRVRPGSPDPRPRVHVDVAVLDRLRPHAERRDIPVREIAAMILATVAAEDMVDAVLDDGGADGHP
jgi:transposase